ncbi:lysozyme inhibitor LprI family protein [Caulobacter sp. LjRoot300]|uniref:lysozyme inhibitor LprI family protein n=1 Tax=Caulobacter sp. LjRoot300 TaxID=3342321 RepID=UPI003ECE45BD
MVRVACWAGVAALVWLAAPTATWAASFDCAKAGTPTERAICKDAAVSKLDEQVAAAFKAAQGLWPAGNWSTFVRNEQREWLKDRNGVCKADVACLKEDYERRLTFLTHPSLKWMGRYIAGRCPDDGVYLDVTPSYPDAGIGAELYVCPDPKGNMLLQARGDVDASGRLSFEDAGCPRVLTLTQDTATLSAPKTEHCAMGTDLKVFRRDPAKSPYLSE